MKPTLPAALLIALLTLPGMATDITTTAGQEYLDVTISRADPDGLVIISDLGIEKIPFTLLPEAIQKHYGYDPASAAAFRAKSAEQRKEQSPQAKSGPTPQSAEQEAALAAKKKADADAKQALAHASSGGLQKRGHRSYSVAELQTNAVALNGVTVELVAPAPDIRKISDTEYKVRWVSDDKFLEAVVTPEAATKLTVAPFYVAVIQADKLSSKVQVLGNALRYDGVDETPVVFWR